MTIYDPQHVRMAGELDAMEARAVAAERQVDQLTSQALHFRERAITAEAVVARVEAYVGRVAALADATMLPEARELLEPVVVDLRAAVGGGSDGR